MDVRGSNPRLGSTYSNNYTIIFGKRRKRSSAKYYCIKCQAINSYNQYITRLRLGLEGGGIGITTIAVSRYIKHYLWEKYQSKCSKCGWNQKHPLTGKVPLEINHIDGNAENNSDENLELICPNCHSLTPNFRNLNKGNGRKWRLDKIHSYTTSHP